MKRSELRQMIKEELQKLNEGFSPQELKQIADMVKKCFNEKDNKGVRDYDTLNMYLGKLPFEVDAADIKIGGWVAQTFDRSNKNAEILCQDKNIGYLKYYG